MRPVRRDDRGATLPEYALLIGLVVVVCIGVISYLTDASDAEVDQRSGEIGTPSEDNALPAGGGGGGGTSTGSTDGGTPTDVVAHVGGLSGATTTSSNGTKWSATVTISVVDASGQPVAGATVTASWSAGNKGGTSCLTSSTGTCPITSDTFNRGGGNPVTSVEFTVSNVSGDSVTSYDSAANTASSLVIPAP